MLTMWEDFPWLERGAAEAHFENLELIYEFSDVAR